ncbi:exopolyphosphatase [Vogesella oryzae]|uniref:exopolyphosphatase n=1 Tax=Vogesella oryzae TaxID=1735285 RepID=UPI0015841AB7|nr:exopolyphosphatase [Vogesella oryzae]
MSSEKYRLVTRSDFDGLVCAVLLNELDLIDEIKFVHPKDMQDGKIDIGPRDITTNLPYVPAAHLVFDHHFSETLRNEGELRNHVIDPASPSAARVVFNYYGGKERFPNVAVDMMTAVDKADSAQFSIEDILNPKDWVLLNYLMDARTGLGRFKDFRISNYALMMDLIQYCRNHTIQEILALPDVRERVDLYFEHEIQAKEQLRRCASMHGHVVVLDLRDEAQIHPINRFAIYAMYPQAKVSIHVMWGLNQQNTVLATGKSIIDRSSRSNIGALMLEYGGGGHEAAGTCQVSNDAAAEVLQKLVARINAEG